MKSKNIFVFILGIVWLCCPRNAGAQQGYCYNTYYSSYTNQSVGSDYASIIQTVQESGYITLNNPAVWGGPNTGWIYPCTGQNGQMQAATHTFSVTNIIGSTGGTYSQTPVPALNYNTYSTSITAPATLGVEYNSQTLAQVACPVAGLLFTTPGPGTGFISNRTTSYIYQSTVGTICTYKLSCPYGTYNSCGAATVTAKTPCGHNFLTFYFTMFRVGTHSTCFGLGLSRYSSTSVDCT